MISEKRKIDAASKVLVVTLTDEHGGQHVIQQPLTYTPEEIKANGYETNGRGSGNLLVDWTEAKIEDAKRLMSHRAESLKAAAALYGITPEKVQSDVTDCQNCRKKGR